MNELTITSRATKSYQQVARSHLAMHLTNTWPVCAAGKADGLFNVRRQDVPAITTHLKSDIGMDLPLHCIFIKDFCRRLMSGEHGGQVGTDLHQCQRGDTGKDNNPFLLQRVLPLKIRIYSVLRQSFTVDIHLSSIRILTVPAPNGGRGGSTVAPKTESSSRPFPRKY